LFFFKHQFLPCIYIIYMIITRRNLVFFHYPNSLGFLGMGQKWFICNLYGFG
jgi:hypothetical protein